LGFENLRLCKKNLVPLKLLRVDFKGGGEGLSSGRLGGDTKTKLSID